MTRKTSAYARKMRRQPQGGTFNGAQWINTIQRCREYTSEPIPGSWLPGGGETASAAVGAALRVRSAYDSIKQGLISSGDFEPHDLLAHAMGVSWLRAIDIAGEDEDSNPMLPILRKATDALRRMADRAVKSGKWGFDGPGLLEVAEGIDLYEEILMASSPAQMTEATETRARILEAQRKFHSKQTTPNKR